MGKEKVNGKKNQIPSQEGAIKLDGHSRNKGTTTTYRSGTEYQPKRIDREVDDRVGRASIYWIIGGILGLFREAMKDAIDYVDTHGELLEQRLEEHKQKKANLLDKFTALETEIIHLLEQVKDHPDNSHLEEE
ncbi:hypothetical protein [Dapis sp. BLCC M172]